MKMTQEIRDGIVILRLSGQLMGGPDADAVRQTIQSVLKQGHRKILIDLEEVSWINSTGLGILISGHMLAANSGGRLKLMRVSKRIDSILGVTRLNTVFEIFGEEEAALKSFAA